MPPERVDLLIKMACAAHTVTPTTGPSISGTPKVGETISAVAATWPTPLVSTGVQLLRNGDVLPAVTHVLTPGDVGATFTARDTGKRPDYVTENGSGQTVIFQASPAATSTAVTGAQGDAAVATSKPTISGTPAVGQTLTAAPGTWSVGGLDYAYTWKAASDTVGSGSNYLVKAADFGKAITVQVTASRAGYATGSATSDPTTAVAGQLEITNTGKPTIAGQVQVGQTLTATPGTWDTTGLTYSYLWEAGATTVGEGATYAVQAADLGKQITVTVTARRTGYIQGIATSIPTSTVVAAPVPVVIANTGKPSVNGAAVIGSSLTATPGSWNVDGLAFTYQWLADGNPIAEATTSTYAVTAGDVGRSIGVRVTASRPVRRRSLRTPPPWVRCRQARSATRSSRRSAARPWSARSSS